MGVRIGDGTLWGPPQLLRNQPRGHFVKPSRIRSRRPHLAIGKFDNADGYCTFLLSYTRKGTFPPKSEPSTNGLLRV